MNVTSKMDKFAKQCIFLGELQNYMVDALFKFPKLPEDVAGIILRLWIELKPMALKRSWGALTTKWFKPKYVPRQRTQEVKAIKPIQRTS